MVGPEITIVKILADFNLAVAGYMVYTSLTVITSLAGQPLHKRARKGLVSCLYASCSSIHATLTCTCMDML